MAPRIVKLSLLLNAPCNRWLDNTILRPFLGHVQIFFYSAASDRFDFFTLVIESLESDKYYVCNGSPLGKFDIVRMRFCIFQFCNCRPSAEGRPKNKHTIRINYTLSAATQFSRCTSDKISASLFLKFIALF
jgi:hypothetical protein